MAHKPLMLIALGGNALIQKGQKGTAKEQFVNLKVPMRQIARLSRKYKIVITHGNGPQVGNLLLQQESCSEVPKMPLEIIGAMTQGQIGYMIESSLDDALMEIGADIFVIASDVHGAGINWGKPEQKTLGKVSRAEMEKYVQEGQFPRGSMGPKVEAILQFNRATGKRGIICHLAEVETAIEGEAGTEIIK